MASVTRQIDVLNTRADAAVDAGEPEYAARLYACAAQWGLVELHAARNYQTEVAALRAH